MMGHQVLEADDEPFSRTNLTHGEDDARHERRAVDRIVPDGERLSLAAEQHLLVRDETGEPHRVDRHVAHQRSTGARRDLSLAAGSARDV